ncbi:MAG: sulfatase [Myxococcota bacterium]
MVRVAGGDRSRTSWRFGARIVIVIVRALSPLLLVICSCSSAPETPRHLILVTIDTLRQDRIGAYGHSDARTPHLDALAARGTRFDDAISQAITTPPSHASILTGLAPTTHGLTQLFGQRLPDRNRTLAEILSETGFETAAFVSAVPLRKDVGLDQGFGSYDDEGLRWRNRTRSASDTNTRVKRWLEEPHTGRLFIWVHYFEPHFPYAPPASYQDKFGRADDLVGVEPLNAFGRNERLSPFVVDAVSRLYDGEVATGDAALGELLAALSNAKILDDAIVAVVADHGESLGERGYYFGHWDVFDETARVPLVIARPDGHFAGTSVEGPVASTDLLPTLLAWLEVPVPAEVEGIDLTPTIERGTGDPRRVIYTERSQFMKPTIRSVRDGRWLVVQRRNREPRFYDRRTGDEAELPPHEAGVLLDELEGYEMRAKATRSVPSQVSEKVAEQLRALGYAQDLTEASSAASQ